MTTDLQQSTIGISAAASALVLALTTAGAGLGWVLPALTGWLLALPWVPLQGPLSLLDRLVDAGPGWVAVLVAAVVGVLAGLGILGQCTSVVVTSREIVLREGSERRRWARSQVHEVVLEGHHLSLRDERDADLVRTAVDGSIPTLAGALRQHGWPLRSVTGA